MAVLMFAGFDERYPVNEDFDDYGILGPATNAPSFTFGAFNQAYENLGSAINWAVGAAANNASFLRLRTNLDHASDRLVIGWMLRREGVFATQPDNSLLACRMQRGGAILDIRRTDPDNNSQTTEIFSTGMDGTDIVDSTTVATTPATGGTGWAALAVGVIDLPGGGIRVELYRNGTLTYGASYPDADWPAGNWEWVEHGMTGRGSSATTIDDLYITDDVPRFNAKVVAVRPDTQGFHDDFVASAGSKPDQTNNIPPTTANISGSPGDLDTVAMETYTPPSGRPFVEAVQYTAYGSKTGGTPVAIVREDGVDHDVGELALGGTVASAKSQVLYATPDGDPWATGINTVEFGLRVNA
jgi:hypothetical protein